jgi:hypothetical protein
MNLRFGVGVRQDSDCLLTLVFAQKGKSISKHGSTYDIEYTGRASLTRVVSPSPYSQIRMLPLDWLS